MNNHKKMCKELYEHYKENGICVKCGGAWSLAGHVLCGPCMQKANLARKKNDPDGSKKRNYMRKLREERRTLGVCVMCGKKTDGVHTQCFTCLEKARQRDQIKRIKRRIYKNEKTSMST